MKARTCAVADQYWPRWVAFAWLSLGVVALLGVAGCRRDARALATTPTAEPATLSGSVRGAQGRIPFRGRTVEAVNIETGERLRATTGDEGAFSFTLKPGRYRLDLVLRSGESLVHDPGVINLRTRDRGASANFVVGTTRVSRPRPAYRVDDGLGAPLA